jgi:energy-converting hydrogenase Eha subunit A
MSVFLTHVAAALLWCLALLFAAAAGHQRARAQDTSFTVAIAFLLAVIAFGLQVIA